MKKQRKPLAVPKFRSENQEREFWSKANLADHFSTTDFDAVAFPDLKPSSRAISIRIPTHLLMRLKERANELHVPYQSLVKRYIAKGVRRERAR